MGGETKKNKSCCAGALMSLANCLITKVDICKWNDSKQQPHSFPLLNSNIQQCCWNVCKWMNKYKYCHLDQRRWIKEGGNNLIFKNFTVYVHTYIIILSIVQMSFNSCSVRWGRKECHLSIPVAQLHSIAVVDLIVFLSAKYLSIFIFLLQDVNCCG